MTKKFIIIILAIIALIAGGWYFKSLKQTDGTIVLGGAFGLSGVCAEWGEGERAAAEMAVDEANEAGGIGGKHIYLIIEDTQCENKTTVNAVSKLIDADGVLAVIGPTWGDSFQGFTGLVREAHVPAVSPSTAMEALEFQKTPIDYIFSTYPPQRAEIKALQKHAVTHAVKKFALIWDQDSYSTMMIRLFKELAAENGIAIGQEYEMPTGSQDFRTPLTKIKKDAPDGIFISLLAPHTKAGLLKQAKELGVSAAVFSSADIQDPSVISNFGKVMDGVIYTYPAVIDRQAQFIVDYRAKYGVDPQGPAAVNAYDATRIVIEALKRGAWTGEEIQTKLMKITIPGTFINTLDFNEKHQIQGGDFIVKTIRNGQFVPF